MRFGQWQLDRPVKGDPSRFFGFSVNSELAGFDLGGIYECEFLPDFSVVGSQPLRAAMRLTICLMISGSLAVRPSSKTSTAAGFNRAKSMSMYRPAREEGFGKSLKKAPLARPHESEQRYCGESDWAAALSDIG